MMASLLSESDVSISRAEIVIDRLWQRLRDSFMVRAGDGRPIDAFPDLSEVQASHTASDALSELAAIQKIGIPGLPHQLAITIQLAQFHLSLEAQAEQRYWLAQSCGLPTMFPISPYGSGYMLSAALRAFTGFAFVRPGDGDRYLALIEDYARLLTQIRQKLFDQAARNIRIPQPAIAGMRSLVTGQAQAAPKSIAVNRERLGCVLPNSFAETVTDRIERRVVPAFAALLEFIGDDYAARAPETVGIGQFRDGVLVYEGLVAEHLSMNMTIDAVHRAGNLRMVQIQSQMAAIRSALGFSDRAEFHRYLLTDPTWVARSQQEMKARFDLAVRRMEPHVDRLFRFKPNALYRTERLDPKLERSMTYGYYQWPRSDHPDGVYYFNAANLAERTLATVPALIYHELIPGHHFHVASQRENELLHPLRQHLLFNAFNEGWAEYAATLAGEVGLYEHPCEQYGRLLNDALLTCRLVVDTGMNALGWSLERAREYLRDHTMMPDAEIASETLRYSTDIPAQSLAYKIGEIKIQQLRERARDALGARFCLRDFHDVVLGFGGMPMEVLDWHVNCWIEQAQSTMTRTA